MSLWDRLWSSPGSSALPHIISTLFHRWWASHNDPTPLNQGLTAAQGWIYRRSRCFRLRGPYFNECRGWVGYQVILLQLQGSIWNKAQYDLNSAQDITVDRDELLRRVRSLTLWKRGSERAPHKPLLLLYALARCRQDTDRLIPYTQIDSDLRALLEEFGPTRKSHHPEYPFWRLQNDGLWIIPQADQLEARQGNTDAKKSELLRLGAQGGFPPEIFELLESDPSLVKQIAHELLEAHFPASIHEDILAAVGLEADGQPQTRPPRDPEFRPRILRAYEYQCAVCELDIRLGGSSLGLEAAHIQWHQAGGPDVEQNGLALCSIHHKCFDRGAWALTRDRVITVSEHVHGSRGFQEWLMAYQWTTA